MTFERLTAFRLVSQRPAETARFFTSLGFTAGETRPIARDEMALLKLGGAGRRTPLHLGGQRIDLDVFDTPGRPYPHGADAAALSFQHFALVTDDAAAAWARARTAGATPISLDGPVTLPPSSGGVTAVKFRDPEGHPLELLQFKADDRHGWTGSGVIGIDHSAISVSDVEASRTFYVEQGLAPQTPSLNRGPTQTRLDGLADVEVDVAPMAPSDAGTPHLELLGYRRPRGRPGEPRLANDVASTRLVWAGCENALVADPDGHLHQLEH